MRWTDEDFRRVFDGLYPSVVRFLRSLTGDGPLARDLAQEAFLRLFQAGPAGSGQGAARFWVFRTAHNLAINETKRRRRWRRLSAHLGRLAGGAAPGPQEISERREQALAQIRLLRELAEDRRAALLLRELEGMTYAEIASTLGVSLAKVKADIHRARTRLREAWRRETAEEAAAATLRTKE